MMSKHYTSFEEIDKDLQILKLKQEISVWTLKNNYKSLQHNLKPKNLSISIFESLKSRSSNSRAGKFIQNIALGYFIKRWIKRKR